jgi:PAS domain-containing protein
VQDLRSQPQPTDAAGYLQQLPALELLYRMPTAMLCVGTLGNVEYANHACAELLGYVDGDSMAGLYLPGLLAGHAARAPVDCVATLRVAPPIVEWNHSEGHVVRTIVSAPLSLHCSEELLLVGIIDITEWLWESGRNSTFDEAVRRSP